MVLLGAPRLKLRFASDKPSALLAVRLCAVAPDGSSERITWRPINLTHGQSHAEPSPMIPGRRIDLDIMLNDIGYTVPAGHRLRLAVCTTYWPMLWPSPEVATVTLYPESALLSLPQLLDGGSSLEIAPPEAPRYPTSDRVPGNVTPFTESALIRETAEGGRGAAAQIKPGQNARFRCVQIDLLKAATGDAGRQPPVQP